MTLAGRLRVANLLLDRSEKKDVLGYILEIVGDPGRI
jgi:hypothetical protein